MEVSLIAQLGHGAGNHLFSSISARQRHHNTFIDELDEPSAQLAGTDFANNDATALYSFAVGPKGHPFHRHAGHRIFTAISGSGGAQLRFSTASTAQIEEDPQNFIRALRFVNIPPDCLFTVRFGGETWHQFSPLSPSTTHPVFFALSCHTNELGGNLPEPVRTKVLANAADIPTLTELLPAAVQNLLSLIDTQRTDIPTTTLSLDAPAGTFHRVVCDKTRGTFGKIRGAWAAWRRASGFLSDTTVWMGTMRTSRALPENALLNNHLSKEALDHEDAFILPITHAGLRGVTASHLLSFVLDGFMSHPPRGVSRLMALRNVLVRPLGLRTSPLGCPVSSLLTEDKATVFSHKYPVLDQRIDAADTQAEVILGADDKHLSFRSSVSVKIINDHQAEISLYNRIHCKNLFGRFYMAAIDLIHRHYIAPAMLRMATDAALKQVMNTSK